MYVRVCISKCMYMCMCVCVHVGDKPILKLFSRVL